VANNDKENQGAGHQIVGGLAEAGNALGFDYWIYPLFGGGKDARAYLQYTTRLSISRTFDFSRPRFSAIEKLGGKYTKFGVVGSVVFKHPDGEVEYLNDLLDLMPDTKNEFVTSYAKAIDSILPKLDKTLKNNAKTDFTPSCKWCTPKPVEVSTTSLSSSIYTYEGCRHACMNIWKFMEQKNKIPDLNTKSDKDALN